MNQDPKLQAEKLYQQFVKPLEDKYKDKYVAVSPKGRTILGSTVVDVLKKANVYFDQAIPFVFKVGQKVVGKWR